MKQLNEHKERSLDQTHGGRARHDRAVFRRSRCACTNGQKIVSYGTSSYGYDVRCAEDFKIFTNINSTIVDPKNFDEKSFVDFKGPVCIIPPNSFALASTVEYFRIPRNVLVACLGKSTYARCFRGDTRVALVDGTAPTLEDMAKRHDSGEIILGLQHRRERTADSQSTSCAAFRRP